MSDDDRLHALVEEVMRKHEHNMDDIIAALFKAVEGDPTLLFPLIGEDQVMAQINNLVSEKQSAGITGPDDDAAA